MLLRIMRIPKKSPRVGIKFDSTRQKHVVTRLSTRRATAVYIARQPELAVLHWAESNFIQKFALLCRIEFNIFVNYLTEFDTAKVRRLAQALV